MRFPPFLSFGLVLFPLAPLACGQGHSSEVVGEGAQLIQGGTLDTGDSAVVAILVNGPDGAALCSGVLIAPNLVLTAHHCVANTSSTVCGGTFGSVFAASWFGVTTSDDAAASVFNGSGVPPAPDGVTWFGVESVAVAGNNICGQDLAALTLTSSPGGVCPLVPAVDVDVNDGEPYTAIGFGVTSPNGQIAGTRYEVSGLSVQCAEDCNDPTQSATQEWLGGSTANKGTCEGDSGGPAIDSSGRVIGFVSRGSANACNSTVYESVYGDASWIKSAARSAANAGGYSVAGWVTGGATTSPANAYACSPRIDGGSSDSGSSNGSSCPSPLTCTDADGMGDYGCFDPSSSTGFPANAPTCTRSTPCATGFSCWATSATSAQGACIQTCTPGDSSDGGDSGRPVDASSADASSEPSSDASLSDADADVVIASDGSSDSSAVPDGAALPASSEAGPDASESEDAEGAEAGTPPDAADGIEAEASFEAGAGAGASDAAPPTGDEVASGSGASAGCGCSTAGKEHDTSRSAVWGGVGVLFIASRRRSSRSSTRPKYPRRPSGVA